MDSETIEIILNILDFIGSIFLGSIFVPKVWHFLFPKKKLTLELVDGERFERGSNENQEIKAEKKIYYSGKEITCNLSIVNIVLINDGTEDIKGEDIELLKIEVPQSCRLRDVKVKDCQYPDYQKPSIEIHENAFYFRFKSILKKNSFFKITIVVEYDDKPEIVDFLCAKLKTTIYALDIDKVDVSIFDGNVFGIYSGALIFCIFACFLFYGHFNLMAIVFCIFSISLFLYGIKKSLRQRRKMKTISCN